MDERQDFDVVVVGGGIAGLSAGVRAAELGFRTAVIEKGASSHYLCNSRISGGVFHIALHDPKLSKAELLTAIRNRTDGTADPILADALSERAGATLDWLRGLGVKFMRAGPHLGNTWLAEPPRPPGARSNWIGTWSGWGPDMLLRVLADSLERFGGTLMLDARAQALVMRNGQCIGVDAIIAGKQQRLTSSAVVIADGGFPANAELLKANITPDPARIQQRNAQTATGDGLRMAQAVGADTTRLDRFYGHLLSKDAMNNDLLWPYPVLDDVAVSGIMVDAGGKRFVDEGYGGVYISNIVAATAGESAVVFDADIWAGSGRASHVMPSNPHLVNAGGTIHSAPTIAALAQAAKLPGDALAATIATYNEACKRGTYDALDPPRTTRKFKAMPIETPPFYAIPACAGITYTMGGIKIDGNARVLDTNGDPIAGLYAAGSATGGLEGMTERALYVGGLCRASVFGKRAAEHIAECVARRR